MNIKNPDRSEPIPLHRMAVVQPFAHFLSDVGTSVERYFRRAHLPYSGLDDIDHYVPSHRFWAFLVDTAHSEGIPDLGLRVGKRFGANSPDPHMAKLLQQAPTVFSGLMRASEKSNRTISHCQVGILQLPNCEHAHFYHKPSCSADHPAIEQISWFGLMILIDMVRTCVGPHWQPAEIGVMGSDQCSSDFIRESFSHAHLRRARTYNYVTLEKTLLCLPPLGKEALMPAMSSPHYEHLPEDFVSSVEQILLSYIQEQDISMEVTADLCKLSSRTLQRKLSQRGTRYSALLDQARFQTASLLLRKPGAKVTDIAAQLGYSDVSHFARAFRRLAGTTPRQYQRIHSIERVSADPFKLTVT